MPANEALALTYRDNWEDRFMAFVDDTDDSCWNWTGAKTQQGYGMFTWAGRGYQASRLMWALERGVPVPEYLSRQCRNPACIRPDHMTPDRGHLTRGRHPRALPVQGPGGRFVSAEAAAEAAGVSSRTLRRWCKKGVDGWSWVKSS